MTDPGTTDAVLDAKLRRIQLVAIFVAVGWLVVSLAGTVWITDRRLAATIARAVERADGDARDAAGVVDQMFHELTAIPQVLSGNREMLGVVARYNRRGQEFKTLTEEQRRNALVADRAATKGGDRLTRIRSTLQYDLIYVLDAGGIRVMSSDWERDPGYLGMDLDDREYFKEAMSGEDGHMFALSRAAKTPAFFFSSPMEDDGQPVGIVVARQSAKMIGTMLAAGRDTRLIVDEAGMIVASSNPAFNLRHVGALSSGRPKPEALRAIYAQEQLRPLDVAAPAKQLHPAEWVIDGTWHVLSKAKLKSAPYELYVFTSIEWTERVQRLNWTIGALAVPLGLMLILLGERTAAGLVRRWHYAKATASLNEKLTKANADKNRYLGIAAHDLRNPLSSIRGLSELMIEAPLEPEQQREFLQTIHRTSDELLWLVNDLLDVAVIESGKLELKRKDEDIAKLVERRIRHLEPQARGKEIALKRDMPDGIVASVDPSRMAQVIDNLVSNAVKFSPRNTTVEVALRREGDRFVLSVQDQGPGIPEADRKLLFKSFQKLTARPTAGEKSTGLGLAIVKKVVDTHGGTIEVESEPGRGTRFIVSIPIAAPQGTAS